MSRRAPTDLEARPRAALATGVAVAAPFVSIGAMVLLALWQHPVRVWARILADARVTGVAACGLALVGALVLVVLGLLAVRARRVPVAAMLLAAGLPWLAGDVGAALGVARARDALDRAAPELAATLLASGTAQAVFSGVIGAWLSSALLAACAVGLLAAALGRRHDRGAAHRVGAALAAGLSIAAAAQALDLSNQARAFELLAAVSPEQRTALLAAALQEGHVVHVLGAWSWVLVLVLSATAGAWSLRRARPSTGGYLGAAMAAVVGAGLLVGGGHATSSALGPALAYVTTDPRAERFVGISLPESSSEIPFRDAIEVRIVPPGDVTVEGRRTRIDQLAVALTRHADRLRAIAAANPRRSFRGELALALDRSVSAGVLLQALQSAARAGFVRPALVVRGRGRPTAPRQIDLLPLELPVQSALALRVELGFSGIRVCGSGGCLAPGCRRTTDAVAPAVSSVEQLVPCLAAVGEQFPDERAATLAVQPSIRCEQLVRVLDATRRSFPDVRLAALP